MGCGGTGEGAVEAAIMARGLGHPEGSLDHLFAEENGQGISAVASSSSYLSLVLVQTECEGMKYLNFKICSQATNCCKGRKLNIRKFCVGRFYFCCGWC